MTIEDFVNRLPDGIFEAKFRELAQSESFSAIASHVGTDSDKATLHDALAELGVPPALYQDDMAVCATVSAIASRIAQKL